MNLYHYKEKNLSEESHNLLDAIDSDLQKQGYDDIEDYGTYFGHKTFIETLKSLNINQLKLENGELINL